MLPFCLLCSFPRGSGLEHQGMEDKIAEEVESTRLIVWLAVVQLSYKITSTCKSLVRNLCASRKYMQRYLPVKGLQGLKLVQDFNYR